MCFIATPSVTFYLPKRLGSEWYYINCRVSHTVDALVHVRLKLRVPKHDRI